MIAGGIVTALGMLLTFIAIVPLADSKVNLPSVFWGLAMITGIGLAVLIYGVWRAARGRSQRIRKAAAAMDDQNQR
jgi:cytosine/uracil/thiamine/allantoin permease